MLHCFKVVYDDVWLPGPVSQPFRRWPLRCRGESAVESEVVELWRDDLPRRGSLSFRYFQPTFQVCILFSVITWNGGIFVDSASE